MIRSVASAEAPASRRQVAKLEFGHGARHCVVMRLLPRWFSQALLSLTLLLGAVSLAVAAGSGNPWGAFRHPVAGEPRAIGDYSGGCIQGAVPLPLDGAGYQVMRPSRLRNFGHPSLIDFVETLGRGVQRDHLGVLLIGDLGQPRGGRANGGHASHQTGLDVDIWFWHPKKAERRPLSRHVREALKARSIVDSKSGQIRAEWSKNVTGMLRLTAEDARVDRIFVEPVIKRQLCREAGPARAWLRKIRPWFGHDDHFHVRLACPSDSPDCQAQDPTPQGDGCGAELAWWFDAKAQADRRKAKQKYQSKVRQGRQWPPACDALLKFADTGR